MRYREFQLQRGLLLSGVVLIAVDAAGFLILLFVQRLAVLLGELAVVLGAHAPLFLVDAGFLVFEVRRLTGRELTTLHALGDSVLLILLALIDGRGLRGCGGRRRCGLSEDRGGS